MLFFRKNKSSVLQRYIEKPPWYDIDLSGTTLRFLNPATIYREKDRSSWYRVIDKRPFVNTISKGEYCFENTRHYGHCSLYQKEWPVFKKNTDEIIAELCLSLVLLTPCGSSFIEEHNFFNAQDAFDWLSDHFRRKMAFANSYDFQVNPDGIHLIFNDDEIANAIVADNAPLPMHSFEISGMPAFQVIYPQQTINICIVTSRRDILKFAFEMTPCTDQASLMLKDTAQGRQLMEKIVSSIQVELSQEQQQLCSERKNKKVIDAGR